MKAPLIIIGGGLSGLAAALRCSRFIPNIILLEQHSRLGGLNSYYYRNKHLLETGLHAITNFAEKKEKKAPLNKLLRQLKISRDQLDICPQKSSEILFSGVESLSFSNDFELLQTEVAKKFPRATFQEMLAKLATVNPYVPTPFISAKKFLQESLREPLLAEMLLCPLMYYGSSVENDMDLGQFAIMFQAIYREGMFRPAGSIKGLLDLLEKQIEDDGGKIRYRNEVEKIITDGKHAIGVRLQNGEEIYSDHILSTIGYHETLALLDREKQNDTNPQQGRLGFIENIFQLPAKCDLPSDRTIIFYNEGAQFAYQQVSSYADTSSGVICFPQNFNGVNTHDLREVRSTHLASYQLWQQKKSCEGSAAYLQKKVEIARRSSETIEKIIGKFAEKAVYTDTFTPLTIERYTAKIGGAIYGNPEKIKDGNIGYNNLFLAGTDQGFLGIVGSMLSGVSIVNQHILPKL